MLNEGAPLHTETQIQQGRLAKLLIELEDETRKQPVKLDWLSIKNRQPDRLAIHEEELEKSLKISLL